MTKEKDLELQNSRSMLSNAEIPISMLSSSARSTQPEYYRKLLESLALFSGNMTEKSRAGLWRHDAYSIRVGELAVLRFTSHSRQGDSCVRRPLRRCVETLPLSVGASVSVVTHYEPGFNH